MIFAIKSDLKIKLKSTICRHLSHLKIWFDSDFELRHQYGWEDLVAERRYFKAFQDFGLAKFLRARLTFVNGVGELKED